MNKNKSRSKIWPSFNSSFERSIYLHKKEREVLYNILLKYSKEEDKILDVGCGIGIESVFLAKKGRKVWAVDKDLEPLKIAKEYSQKEKTKINFKKADATKLPFKDEKFDMVFSIAMLHFLPQKKFEKAISEQIRVLKKGGILIIDVPYKYSIHTIYKKIMIKLGKWPWGKEKEFSRREIKRILNKYNLKLLKEYSWGLDRISKILFNFHETRFGKYMPPVIRKMYSYIFLPIRTFIERLFPVNIGFVYKKI